MYRQFIVTILVCRTLSEDFPEEEDTETDVGGRSFLNATKLDNRINFLSQNPTATLVFEEGDLTEPRLPREEPPVESIDGPVGMASSNESIATVFT